MLVSHEHHPEAIAPGLYRHFKGGVLYEVVGLALDAESDPDHNQRVVYHARGSHNLYHRSAKNFFALVEDEEGNRVPRFRKVEA